MTEKQERELKKAFTWDNFKKLLYFVNGKELKDNFEVKDESKNH